MENQQKKSIKKLNSKGDKMAKARYIAFINDNSINLLDLKNDFVYQQNFQNLKKDEITNESKFYFELNSFIRKNKIKIPILGHKLKLILSDSVSHLQKNIYKEIFEDYFQCIECIDIKELINLSKNTGIINITENYVDFYYLKKGEIKYLRNEYVIFNNNEYRTIAHIINTIFTPQKIIVFGTSKLIPKLTARINKELGIECTYPEDYNNYILNEYIKTKAH